MKVYELPEGQGLDRRNDMAWAFFVSILNNNEAISSIA